MSNEYRRAATEPDAVLKWLVSKHGNSPPPVTRPASYASSIKRAAF